MSIFLSCCFLKYYFSGNILIVIRVYILNYLCHVLPRMLALVGYMMSYLTVKKNKQ